MKLTIKQAIRKIILENENLNTLDNLAIAVKELTGTRYRLETVKEKIYDYLAINPIARIDNENKIWYRKKIFQNSKFRVKLTSNEFKKKELVIGHRFTPFMNNELKFNKLVLLDSQDTPYKSQYRYNSLDDYYIYHSLLDISALATLFKDDRAKLIKVYSFNLTEFIEKNNFKINDRLLISTIDYEKGIYRIEKVSNKEDKDNLFFIRDSDKKLESSIEETIQHEGVMKSFDHLTLISYGKLDDGIFEIPPSSFSDMMHDSKKIELFNNGVQVSIKLKGTTNFEDMFAESAKKIPEMGTSKTLNGIFQELGISYTEDFVKLYMIYNYGKNSIVDINGLTDIIFGDEISFFNENQKKNYIKAFTTLINKTLSRQTKHPLDDSLFEISLTFINGKIEFVEFLREMDYCLDGSDNFDVELFMNICSFNEMIDVGIYNIVNGKSKTLKDIGDDLSIHFEKLHNQFCRMKEEMIDSLK